MLAPLENPVAVATVQWLSKEVGGRRGGPPSIPPAGGTYGATTELYAFENMDRYPEHRADPGFGVSILLEPTEFISAHLCEAKVGFLVPDALILPCLWVGRQVLIMEGARIVALARITEVFTSEK